MNRSSSLSPRSQTLTAQSAAVPRITSRNVEIEKRDILRRADSGICNKSRRKSSKGMAKEMSSDPVSSSRVKTESSSSLASAFSFPYGSPSFPWTRRQNNNKAIHVEVSGMPSLDLKHRGSLLSCFTWDSTKSLSSSRHSHMFSCSRLSASCEANRKEMRNLLDSIRRDQDRLEDRSARSEERNHRMTEERKRVLAKWTALSAQRKFKSHFKMMDVNLEGTTSNKTEEDASLDLEERRRQRNKILARWEAAKTRRLAPSATPTIARSA